MIERDLLKKDPVNDAARRSLDRVAGHVHGRNVGIITAYSPEYDPEINCRRIIALATDIRGHGFGLIYIRGYAGASGRKPKEEHSYLLIGKAGDDSGNLRGFLKKHGRKYDQDAVILKPHNSTRALLMGTMAGTYPGLGVTLDIGEFHPNRVPLYHSILRRGGGPPCPGQPPAAKRTFAFEGLEGTEPVAEFYDYAGGRWFDFHFWTGKSFFTRKDRLF